MQESIKFGFYMVEGLGEGVWEKERGSVLSRKLFHSLLNISDYDELADWESVIFAGMRASTLYHVRRIRCHIVRIVTVTKAIRIIDSSNFYK